MLYICGEIILEKSESGYYYIWFRLWKGPHIKMLKTGRGKLITKCIHSTEVIN